MNPPWINRETPMYIHNFSVGTIHDSNFNNPVVNNIRQFKPRAYVNPEIVKGTRLVPESSAMRVYKKIHINPNFKGNSIKCFERNYNRQIESKNDVNSVHINPNFKTNIDDAFQIKEDPARYSLLTTLEPKPYENCRILRLVAREKLSPNDINGFKKSYSDSNNIVTKYNTFTGETFCSATQKPTYFWCKNNGKSTSERYGSFQKITEEKGCQNHTKASPHKLIKNLSFPINQSAVKRRFKLIKKTHTNEVNNLRCNDYNYKYRLLNRYKVINIKRLKSEPISEAKKNIFSHTKLNIQHVSKKENNDVDNRSSLNNKVNIEKAQPLEVKDAVMNINLSVKENNLFKPKFVYKKAACICKTKLLKVLFPENTKYKLDKRKKYHQSIKKIANSKIFYDIRKLFPKKVPVKWVKSVTWASNAVQWKQNRYKFSDYVWRKQMIFDKDVLGISKTYPNQTVVNIGGIMYKSTINKLTRTKEKKKSLESIKRQFNQSIIKSGSAHHVVYVRGQKFLLDDHGKTLIRQPNVENESNDKFSVKRVDIGGVTYIQKSNNILIRTNTHQARNLVNHAKQRSIALLYNLHKRNNMPCMIYQRFGQCTRYSKGMCIYVHDPKNIALCQKFLSGECTSSSCLLSHDVVKEKMATCHFFLKGNCNRENCPFLHVKVNKKATICKHFLHGFCKLGQNCKKRHIHQCPDYDIKGFCIKGKKCPYPHKTNSKKKNKSSKKEDINSKSTTSVATDSEKKNSLNESEESGKINFQRKRSLKVNGELDFENDFQIKNKKRKHVHQEEQMKILEVSNNPAVECIPKRVKLSDLPLFIPLETDK